MDPTGFRNTEHFQNASPDMLEFFSRWMSIKGKRCLCIGFDRAQLEKLILAYSPSSVTLLTLWQEHKDAEVPGYTTVIGDICQRTDFDDGTFDAVLTLSLLEHIHDVEAAFVEIRRILASGGYFGSFFGPAWSCHVGHHLYSEAQNPLFDFWQRGLPAHMHLKSSRDEIADWYRAKGASDDQIATVLHWFFDADIINRVFFDDYPRLLARHFQMVGSEVMYSAIGDDEQAELRSMFPGREDFSSYGGKFLVRKRSARFSAA